MSMYSSYTLFLVDPQARLTSELRSILQTLQDDGWQIEEETPLCVVMSHGGNYVLKGLPRFPECPDVLLVLSGTNESSQDNHYFEASYWDNYIYGEFDHGGTHCESKAIPAEVNGFHAICRKIRIDLGDEYIAAMKSPACERVVPLSEWMATTNRADLVREQVASQPQEYEKLRSHPIGSEYRLSQAVEATLNEAVSGTWDSDLLWELGVTRPNGNVSEFERKYCSQSNSETDTRIDMDDKEFIRHMEEMERQCGSSRDGVVP